MVERPASITAIAWILIVLGVISLIATPVSLNNPMVKELLAKSPIPAPIQYVMMFVGLFVSIISGIGLLKKQNWARFLYAIGGVFGFLINFLTSPMKAAMIPSFIVFIVIVFFLFRPASNKYFIGNQV